MRDDQMLTHLTPAADGSKVVDLGETSREDDLAAFRAPIAAAAA